MKRPAKITLIVLSAAVLALLVIVANVARSHSQVRGIEVTIRHGDTPPLVSRQAVIDTVLHRIPNLLQLTVSSVDTGRVASAARRVPYLTQVSASVSAHGKIVVRARQRRPIARLYYGTHELYIDRSGTLFPPSSIGFCDVLVAGGQFTEPPRPDSLDAKTKAIWKLALFLDEEKDYRSLIDQIYIEQDGNIIMVPKVGDHVIELGSISNLENKFSNLLTFYRKGMPRAGWDTYSKISLKFKDQVVCTKKTEK